MGMQLYFPSKSAFPPFESTVGTISQIISPYISSKLPASPLLWDDDLAYLRSGGNLAPDTARSTTLHLVPFSLPLLPVLMDRYVSTPIKDQLFCLPLYSYSYLPSLSCIFNFWILPINIKTFPVFKKRKKNPFYPKSHFTNLFFVLLHKAEHESFICTHIPHFLFPIFFLTISVKLLPCSPLEMSSSSG